MNLNLNRIHQIAVYARDLDEAISFYRDTLGAKYVTKYLNAVATARGK